MNKIKRLWIEAANEGIDNRLINVLGRLKVFPTRKWNEYVDDCTARIFKARREEMDRMARHIDIKDRPQYSRAPKSIKPTRSRTNR